ncbi:MAG: hypothetical protein ACYCPS_04375 [Candidatus Saccharimonadales bacterium]
MRIKNIRSTFVVILLIFICFNVFSAKVAALSPINIVDLSWPNCNLTDIANKQAGIIGINGGLVFSHNPCLSNEVNLFANNYALYLNTGYPGYSYGLKYSSYPIHCLASNYDCVAYNFGYNAAAYSIEYADLSNAHSFRWWLDVETENSWTNSIYQNRASLEGTLDAVKQYVHPVNIGFYSFPGQWHKIVGNWENKAPEWVASASNKLKTAIQFCHTSFNSGPILLSQYTTKLDFDYNCAHNNSFVLQIR